MSQESLIPLKQLCIHYEVEMSFFSSLHEHGLIEIQSTNESLCIEVEKVNELERMVRMHKDLNINIAGIDAVLNLLEKIDALQTELTTMNNRLRLYDPEE